SFDGALSLLPDGAPLAVRVLVERAYLAVRDRRPRALDEAQRAFEAAAGHPIEELRARAVLGATLLYGGQAGWDEGLTSAGADANAIGDADLACTAAFHLSSGLGFVGRLREAADVALAQSQIAEREGLTTWRLHFLAALALDRVMLGEELEWVVDTSSRLIAQHPLFRNRYELEGSLVFALYDLERVDDARARAEQHWACAESDEGRIFAATVLSEVDWMAGDDLSVMQRAIGVRPLGDAWFGMRF